MDKKDELTLNLTDVPSHETEEKIEQNPTPAPDLGLGALNKENCVNTPKSSSSSLTQQSESTDSLITTTLLKELIRLLQPRPFRKRHPIIFWGFLILIGLFIYSIVSFDTSDRIAVVRIKGSINGAETTLKWITKIKQTESVKGVLLRIDSPGGGVGASQEIYSALLDLNKTKPVIASMSSTAASGGLMIAMAARHIVANPSTITGSIGVRMDIPQIYKLLNSIGVSLETLSTGKYKDAGSMMRALSPEERSYLQSLMQNLYDQFIEVIAKSRKMTIADVKSIGDGRMFTGVEAKKLGLVDSIGGQDVALAKLRELTGVSEKTALYERPKDFEEYYDKTLKSIIRLTLDAQNQEKEFSYR